MLPSVSTCSGWYCLVKGASVDRHLLARIGVALAWCNRRIDVFDRRTHLHIDLYGIFGGDRSAWRLKSFWPQTSQSVRHRLGSSDTSEIGLCIKSYSEVSRITTNIRCPTSDTRYPIRCPMFAARWERRGVQVSRTPWVPLDIRTPSPSLADIRGAYWYRDPWAILRS